MKILHTSDMHFGKRWGGMSLLDDQNLVIDEILGLCVQHEVDMLLVAGDVFSDRLDGGRLAEVARSLLSRLRPTLEQGRIVFLLRGNHDPFGLFNLLSFMLTEISGGGSLPLVVASLPGIYSLPGTDTEVIAMPYVPPSWLKAQLVVPPTCPEDQVSGLSDLFSLSVRRLYERVSTGVPSIFTAHSAIEHAELRPDMEVESSYVRELMLHASDLPHFTSYNALGHIHLGQEVRGIGTPTWYSGAPDRLDLGEREYRPQVLLVTTPETPGGAAVVEPVPITGCTTWVLTDLHGEEAVDSFCLDMANRNPIGQVTIFDVAPAYRMAVESRLRVESPRVAIRWAADASDGTGVAIEGPNPHDVYGTVRAYLDAAFTHDPIRHASLVSAFESLWTGSREVSA